jgi:hypothetical protein
MAAAQATLDAFREQPFKWGERDCFRMAAHCLRGLGHNVRLARFGRYATERAAAKALLRNGYRDVTDVLDEMMFPRIPPAAAVAGDIVGFRHPDQGLITGLSVHLGSHRVLAFLGDDPEHRAYPVTPDFSVEGAEYFAWRCDPCRS